MSSSSSGPVVTDPTKECDCTCTTGNPVRYGNGCVVLDETDLSGRAFGFSWGHTRSYGNQLSRSNTGFNGNSWLVAQTNYIVFLGPDLVAWIRGVNSSSWLRKVGDVWVGELGANLRMWQTGNEWRIYNRSNGLTHIFHGDSSPWFLLGQLKQVDNAAGRGATIDRDTQGRIKRWQASDGSPVPSRALRFDYVYHATGAGSGRLAQVTKVVTVDGVERNVRRASYEYYGMSDANGNFKDLKSVVVEQWDGTRWQVVRKSFYRYYVPGDPDGFTHGLKYLMGPASVRQMELRGVDPGTAPNDNQGATLGVAGFADKYFQYNPESQKVTLERVDGGSREFTFGYQTSGFEDGYNSWATRTEHVLPDGTTEIAYCNYMRLVMFKIRRTPDSREWYDYYRFDDNGRTILTATSEAVQSYDEGEASLVTLKSDRGLIQINKYYATTDPDWGAAQGFLHYDAVKVGAGGHEIRQNEFEYLLREAGGQTVFKQSKATVYTANTATGASEPAVTTMGYSWYPDTLQVKEMTKTLPVVSAEDPDEHGDGFSYSVDEFYDEDGYNTWSRDELGVITRRVYNRGAGVVIQLIRDVQTSGMTGVPDDWVTLPGNGLNVVTDYQYDTDGRQTQELGPVHQVDLAGVATMVRTASYTVYRDDIDEVWKARGYATGSAPGYNYVTLNPVTVTRKNPIGQTTDVIQARRDGPGRLAASDSFPQSAWLAWTSSGYDQYNRLAWQRGYFEIPAGEGDAGTSGVNFNQTDYGYDIMARRNRERSGGGTITRTVYDARGKVVSTWVGTNDTGATDSDPANGGADGNNMVKVGSNLYDYEDTPDFEPHGNGLLTRQIQHLDATEERVTNYRYDWRGRLVATRGEEEFYQQTTYNNRSQNLVTERLVGDETGDLLSRSENFYDPLGRVYQQKIYGIEAGTPTGTFLVSNSWFDGAGNLIKNQQAGRNAYTKIMYDSLDRQAVTFVCYPEDGLDDGPTNEVDADIVIEQNETEYDDASNVIATTRLLRFHDATGSGPLNGPDGSQPKSRNYHAFAWSDPISRNIATADFGTNGGTPPSRPALIPASSANQLVSTTTYDEAGRAATTINAQGIVNRNGYDALGRVIQTIENFTNGIPDGSANRTTGYSYNADGLLELLTLQNSATGAQVTRWLYGTTLEDSGVASTRLLAAKIFADSVEAANPSMEDVTGNDRIDYLYNRLGQVVAMRDQNDTVHEYDYDGRGRQTADRVTTLGSGVNGAVRRIETQYDNLDHVTLVTSFDDPAAGAVVNEVARSYDAFGQLASDAQAHAGTVDGDTPLVGYVHADGADHTARLTDIIYPYGRAIRLGYGAAESADDWLSRVAKVEDVSTSSPWEVAEYAYIGADTSVISSYPQPGVELTYLKQGSEPDGAGGDPYAGLDRFGRIIDHRWMKDAVDIERLQYGFNRVSLRQWRLDTIAHAAAKDQDNYYDYDGLGQVTARDQGQLANDRLGINGTPAREEDWLYDPTGNWQNYQRRRNGILDLDQDRTSTPTNEILTYAGSGTPVDYDPAGNMVRIPMTLDDASYYEAIWDAWHRLMRVKTPAGYSGPALDIAYAYDGLTRRTTKAVAAGPGVGTTTHFYYNADWKCVEERLDSTTVAYKQYVFGSRGRNDLVFREQFEGSLSDRVYALCDNMGSKVAVTASTGDVMERYAYTAFGDLAQIMAPDYSARASSVVGWETLFHGELRDPETGWYDYGHRYYLPALGRWPSRDPIGEKGGNNIYCFALNNGPNKIDLLGEKPIDWNTVWGPQDKRILLNKTQSEGESSKCTEVYSQQIAIQFQVAEPLPLKSDQLAGGGAMATSVVASVVGIFSSGPLNVISGLVSIANTWAAPNSKEIEQLPIFCQQESEPDPWPSIIGKTICSWSISIGIYYSWMRAWKGTKGFFMPGEYYRPGDPASDWMPDETNWRTNRIYEDYGITYTDWSRSGASHRVHSLLIVGKVEFGFK